MGALSGDAGLSARHGGQTLMRRLQRAALLVRNTHIERGWKAAGVVLGRLLWLKVPLLLRHLRAAAEAPAVRAAVARARAESIVQQPYLALAVTGGLGDFLVIARFVRDLAASIGGMRFDVFSPTPAQATWAFSRIPGFRAAYHDILFNRTIAEYDVGLRASQFVVVYPEHVRWESIRGNEHLIRIIDSLVRFRPAIDTFIDGHPWLDNSLAREVISFNATRRDFLHHMADLPYGGELLPVPADASVVSRMGLRPGQYITLHNGFDTGFVISGRRATKCYPHFGAVVARLKAALPHMQFVQIGTVTSESIPECDLILVNKTSLDEAAGLLAQAALHIDNEGGLVHLAACLGTRCAVVFGPTPSDYFGYPDNINIDPPVCGNCWWTTRTWMDVCAMGYAVPRCMVEQDPRIVAERILEGIVPTAPLLAGLTSLASTGFGPSEMTDGSYSNACEAD